MVEKFDKFEKYKAKKFAGRLWRAIESSRKAMRPFLDFRHEVFLACVGKDYAKATSQAEKETIINKMEQGMTTYSRTLSAKYPRVRIKTKDPEKRAIGRSFQEVLTRDLREQNFRAQLQDITLDALTLFGISKTGLNHSGLQLEIEGQTYDPMQPYFQRVSPDNFVMDMGARSWDSLQFAGDLVQRDLEALKDTGLYDLDDKDEQIAPDDGSTEYDPGDRTEELSRKKIGADERLFDTVSFWEIYIPRDNVVVSMLPKGKVIRVHEYNGPEFGPYEMLSFLRIPDNLVPLSPAHAWMPMHRLISGLTRKLAAQARRQKTILAVLQKAAKTGRKIEIAQDGQLVYVDQKGGVEEVNFGGIDSKNYTFLIWVLQQFNLAAGNLELMGGLAPQSGTVGQDQLLQQNASIRVDDMRAEVVMFATKNIEKLAWYHWTDELTEFDVSKKVNGLPFEVNGRLTPEMREMDFNELGLEIEPYSMLPRSPSQDRAELMEDIQLMLPLAPMLQQQGVNIDAAGVLDLMSEYGNIHQLDRLLQVPQPDPMGPGGMGQEGQGSPEGANMPAHTVRENVRTNVSGTTQRGNDAALAAAMQNGAGAMEVM